MLAAGSAITDQDRGSPGAEEIEGERGALTIDELRSITADSEAIHAAVRSRDGLTRLDGDEERHVDVTVVLVVTDERIVFLQDDPETGGTGPDVGALPFEAVANVSLADGDGTRLEIVTADGVAWRVRMPTSEGDAVDAAVRHLTWIGRVRSRVRSTRNDVELAAGELADCAAAMEWDGVDETYATARRAVDRLVGDVQRTTPVAADDLAPEVTPIERTLEAAYAAALIERASSRLELSHQLVGNEDYQQAIDVLDDVRELHDRAREHARGVERADAFRFGEQRRLDSDLRRLSWEIDAVAAEPLRQAHEARILAEETDDPEDAAESWERALRRYRDVLALERDVVDGRVPGDDEEVRAQIDASVTELLAIHRALAESKREEGVERHDEGDAEAARRNYAAARDHLERARELAGEYDSDATGEIDERLARVTDSLEEVREAAASDDQDQPTDDGSNSDDTATSEGTNAPAGRTPPEERYSADRLRNIDSATTVTLAEGAKPAGEPEVTDDGEGGGTKPEDEGETADSAESEGEAESGSVVAPGDQVDPE